METLQFDPETFQPTSNHVLVRRRPEATRTSSGLIDLPPTAQAPSEFCDVLKVGPGASREDGTIVSMDLKVGDVAIISEMAGHQFEADGVHYVVIRENHVPAVVDEAA